MQLQKALFKNKSMKNLVIGMDVSKEKPDLRLYSDGKTLLFLFFVRFSLPKCTCICHFGKNKLPSHAQFNSASISQSNLTIKTR
jgi:hypothetical protein